MSRCRIFRNTFSVNTRTGRRIIGLNEHRAIENTTQHDFYFASQPDVEQQFDIRQTKTDKNVHKDKKYMSWIRIFTNTFLVNEE